MFTSLRIEPDQHNWFADRRGVEEKVTFYTSVYLLRAGRQCIHAQVIFLITVQRDWLDQFVLNYF